MQIHPFKAIRFNNDYWNMHKALELAYSDDKIKCTKNIIEYLDLQIANGAAKIDIVPSLYILKITSTSKSVISIIGEIDYNDKSVMFMNECVNLQKLKQYKSMFLNAKIQTTPVLTFYNDVQSIEQIVSQIDKKSQIINANICGNLYELWNVTNFQDIENIKLFFKPINRLYIADGHHRFSLFTNMQSTTLPRLVISITDSNSILLKSCHRVICGTISNYWINRIAQFGLIESISSYSNTIGKIVIIFRDGKKFSLDCREKMSDMNIFDIVQKNVIEISFQVTNCEENVFPIPGNVSPDDCEQVFNLYKNASVAIFVPSIDMSDFLHTIDNGHKLPATSTWFEPKIAEGFIFKKF